MSLNSRSCTYCIEDVHKFVILVHGSDGVFLHAALENVHTYPLTDHWHLQERPVGQCKAKNFKGVYDTTLEFLEALGGGGRGGSKPISLTWGSKVWTFPGTSQVTV